MLKNVSILVVCATVLVACGGGGAIGFSSLGPFFAQAFAQDRNDEPLSLEGVSLRSFPTHEPFNP